MLGTTGDRGVEKVKGTRSHYGLIRPLRELPSSKINMGADWYTTLIIYGYKIHLPTHTTFPEFLRKLAALNRSIPAPFVCTALLSEFHSRMEYASADDLSTDLDHLADICIGFTPPNDLTTLTTTAQELRTFLQDNPMLMGLDISATPQFFTGIDWFRY